MKIFFTLFVTLFATSSFALVLKSNDYINGCDLYRVSKTEAPTEVSSNETVFLNRAAYGIMIENMDIDFVNEHVSVTPIIQVVLGFNKPLVERVIIEKTNKDFKLLTNQLNKNLFVFESMCLSPDNIVVYGKVKTSKL
jgi:hypothetical protein